MRDSEVNQGELARRPTQAIPLLEQFMPSHFHPANSSLQKWIVQSSEMVLDNRWARVRCDSCLLPGGRVVPDYFYWVGGDYSQIVALTPENDVILTRQYKHGVKEIVTELPVGLIDAGDESPLAAAQRELREETGFTAPNWRHLGTLNVSAGKATTQAHLFLATDAVCSEAPQLDPNEQIEVLFLPFSGVMACMVSGEIRDSGSLAAMLLALKALDKI